MALVQLKPARLPPKPSMYEAWSQYRPNYKGAYDCVLLAERQALGQVESDPTDKVAKDNLISARVAGYLLIELWNRSGTVLTETPCREFVLSLVSGHEDSRKTVFDVGKFHRDYFLRLFRTSTKRYPTPSTHPSRPSFDTKKAMIEEDMKADGKDYRTARRKALARDGFRCVLTGTFDRGSLRRNSELSREAEGLDSMMGTVNTCHILNESTMQDIHPSGDGKGGSVVNKKDYAPNAITILDGFGLHDLVKTFLVEDGIHDLGNLISLWSSCHEYFDNLELWFESTDRPNRYHVCVVSPYHRTFLRKTAHLEADSDENLYITFTRYDESQKFPDPKLLELHATCARVAHMSGAAEAFDELERDVEETLVLSSDGSSAQLLDHLLTPFAIIPGVA